ncbi:TetR/AcrR family transcriptional regulator [Pantoea cypripedii]|uniref:Bilin biosynthesis protein CpeZ n=1 Tax=Pantoea cypripedii TaxID=55209 RepID=A0A1X1EU69_PANCY|nr:TetR/AcrR family transcriptional regulator [Pantoea cypripedii]MBP2197662.1 AcrR family transcriptional regulator [Pantoea cypripedii]ORM93546.1 bilin biosynthesis protein CpeZ [Pantoea cypripedii]
MTRKDFEDFTLQRKQLIISAAKVCFSRSGFHGASMAEMSAESGLGAAQIYRYFSSKELLVIETVKVIATEWRTFLENKLSQQPQMADIIARDSVFWQGWSIKDQCLLLEVYSEASRNASVRDILAEQEQQLIAMLDNVFQQREPQATAEQRFNQIHFLLLLIDGVACRTFVDDGLDQQELARLSTILSEHLLP